MKKFIEDISHTLLTPRGLLKHISAKSSDSNYKIEIGGLPYLSSSNLATIAENKNELAKIDPRHFEELVAELLRADGYEEVTLVPRHNAPGPDIIALCNNPSGTPQQFLIEVKRWNTAVAIDAVRTIMYRTDLESRSNGAMIVTTSRFTKDAMQEKERIHKWRLDLVDGEKVQKWIRCHMHKLQSKTITPVDINTTTDGDKIISLLCMTNKTPRLRYSVGGVCQRCGGDVVCGYIDLGGSDWDDNYFHVCTRCLEHSKIRRIWTDPANGGNDEGLAECPFCQQLW